MSLAAAQIAEHARVLDALGVYPYLTVVLVGAFGGTLVFIARWFRRLDDERVRTIAELRAALAASEKETKDALRGSGGKG